MNFVFAHFTVLQLTHQGGCAEGNFIQTILAMHHQHTLCAQALHHADLNTDEVRVEHPHQGVGRPRRIGQRSQNIENRAHPHFATYRRNVLHGTVVVGGKHETDAAFFDTGGHLLRPEIDVGTEGFQHIGASRA